MFSRNLYLNLIKWKTKQGRLPLILWGARQVGKSTSIEFFGSKNFQNCHTFNFQKSGSLKKIFETGDLVSAEILQALELTSGKKIGPNDLLFFDEIQECPEALTSLKYFAESLPTQAVVAAGSYLGLIKNESAFPVGKVEFLSLHPMTFMEFLQNIDPKTHETLTHHSIKSGKPIPEFYHTRALHWLRIYFSLGGLPEVIKTFANQLEQGESDALKAARVIQNRLLDSYRSDFSKHSGTINANHILRVFDSTATQLGQALDGSVNRFKFSGVIPQSKGFEKIDGPLTWLEKSRLLIKTHISSRFEHPVKAFTKQNTFKAYLFDIGILNAMLEIPIESILTNTLGMYKGYIAENFVAQELYSNLDHSLVGWSEGDSEIEFAVSLGKNLCPIEVKASTRSRRSKSLDAVISKYHPKLAFKVTGQNLSYNETKKTITLPLYMISQIWNLTID